MLFRATAPIHHGRTALGLIAALVAGAIGAAALLLSRNRRRASIRAEVLLLVAILSLVALGWTGHGGWKADRPKLRDGAATSSPPRAHPVEGCLGRWRGRLGMYSPSAEHPQDLVNVSWLMEDC